MPRVLSDAIVTSSPDTHLTLISAGFLMGTRTINDMPATAPRFGRAPGAWPFLGHVVALQRRPLALLDSLPAHGDLVEIRLGPRPAYVVCHPALARQVLTDLR